MRAHSASESQYSCFLINASIESEALNHN